MPCLVGADSYCQPPTVGKAGVPRSRLEAAKPLLNAGLSSEPPKRDSPPRPRHREKNCCNSGPSMIRSRKHDESLQVWLSSWKSLLSRRSTARAILDPASALAAVFTVTISNVCPLSLRRSSESDSAEFSVTPSTVFFLLSHEPELNFYCPHDAIPPPATPDLTLLFLDFNLSFLSLQLSLLNIQHTFNSEPLLDSPVSHGILKAQV